MSLMHGKTAEMYWDVIENVGSNTELQHGQSWTCDLVHDVEDITSMQDTWRTFNSGFKDWTATVTCLLDSADTDIPIGGDDGMADDECGLELYFNYAAADYQCVYGTAICTGKSIGQDKDGVPTVTYNFQGVDQLVWYSDTKRPGVV